MKTDESTTRALGEYSGQRDMERFWEEIEPRREPLQKRWFLPGILLLLIISVPWYLPQGFVGPVYGGLAVWIWIALISSVLIAALTALVSLRHWDDDDPAEDPETRQAPAERDRRD